VELYLMMATRNRPPLYERIEHAISTAAKVTGQALLLAGFVSALLALMVLGAAVIQ
jgi:hypothetical protein